MAPPAHDAFLSYSQSADGRLAPVLEVGLEKLAKPLFRLRAIDVFRDKTGLAASPGLWSSIAAHLEASRWLIFLASPAAAASPWCAKELAWWLDRHGTDRLLFVLTDGTLAWDAAANDLDLARTDALPASVSGRLREEPLYVDLRWARKEKQLGHRDPRLRPALLDLAAPIRAVAKDVLDGEDVRQQKRTRRIATAAVTTIVAAAGLATWQAIEATRQRDEANRLRERGLSRQLAAQSASLLVRNPVLALQLAAESHTVAPTVEGRSALLGAVSALPVSRLHQHGSAWWALAVSSKDELVASDILGGLYRGSADGAEFATVVKPPGGLALFSGVDAIAFAPDGSRWAHAGASGDITVRSGNDVRTLESGDKVGENNPSLRVLGLAFDRTGRLLATASTSGAVFLHDLDGGTRRLLGAAGVDLAAVAFSPDGKWVAAGGDHGLLKAFAVEAKVIPPGFSGSGRSAVESLVFDATGRRLHSASRAGRIEIFDAGSGRLATSLDVLDHGALEKMAVSPDGRYLATGHATGAVVLWYRDSDNAPWSSRVLLRHAAAVRGLAFAADGKRLVSAGADGRLFVTLPVDRGRWTRLDGPAPTASAPASSASPDGRWIAKATGPGSPEEAFKVDLGGLSLTRTARLTVMKAADQTPIADNAELPVEPGEKSSGRPVFSADSATIALQVSDRIVLFDVSTLRALDASIPLPPGARLTGTEPAKHGWLAGSATARYALDADPQSWLATACSLAGGPMAPEPWKRYLGDNRPYAPACH